VSGGAATLPGAIAAQTRVEVLLTLRRGENVLITLIVPVILLVFFASLGIAPAGQSAVAFLMPGMLALAVISTGMVSLGIATAYERHYRVLKRLGGTPLPRAGLIAAKAVSVLLLELAQTILLGAVAVLIYGWRPGAGLIPAAGILLLGTAAFTGIGLAMAGGLRAEATLAGANGLYLVFLLLGDIVLPVSRLPLPLQIFARALPGAAFSRSLRAVLGPGTGTLAVDLPLLSAWAIVSLAVAAATFRWD
jgi:ABC-2 type transport system permease protein